jgi:hypothetical protein
MSYGHQSIEQKTTTELKQLNLNSNLYFYHYGRLQQNSVKMAEEVGN